MIFTMIDDKWLIFIVQIVNQQKQLKTQYRMVK